MVEALGGALLLGGTLAIGLLVQHVASLFGRKIGGTLAAVIGFAGTIAILAVIVVVTGQFRTARLSASIAADNAKKAEFLRQVCEERRRKGEIPGAGC